VSDEKPDAPARKPVAQEISEGVLIACGSPKTPKRRRTDYTKILDRAWEEVLSKNPRYRDGIPPESELPNSAFYWDVKVACGELRVKPPKDIRVIKAWRRKRS
jgi:hypothetical protein